MLSFAVRKLFLHARLIADGAKHCSVTAYWLAQVPSWCVKALRPRLRLSDRVYSAASQLHKLVFAYNFLVYVVTGRQFRAELTQMLCRPGASVLRILASSRQSSQQSADTAV